MDSTSSVNLTTTCGMCDISNIPLDTLRNCSICQGHLCLSIQKGPRTICSHCISDNRHQFNLIFPNGKDSNGNWIDPGTLKPLSTCKLCGSPRIPMFCFGDGHCLQDL